MENLKQYIPICIALIIATLIIIFVPRYADKSEISTETETITECITEEQKTSEIATESVTEAPTVLKAYKVFKVTTEEPTEETTEEQTDNRLLYSAVYDTGVSNRLTRSNGVVYYNGHRETWYSTNEGAGQTTARSIPGKHVADDGTIRDEDGYICVASSDLRFYTVVQTTLGPGKVYDCGCSHGTIDVYTNW